MDNRTRAWGKIHSDFKTVTNGERRVLVLDEKTGATVLVPWEGREVESDA